MKFITEFSVKNSLLVNVLSVLILITGLISLKSLNREAFPNIDFDIVSITTYYPSSTPEEVEKLITIPIEKELKGIDDIDKIYSASGSGISVITLQLNEDASNKDRIVNEIQRAVDQTEDLPSDLPAKPIVKDLKTKDTPVIEVSLSGDLSENELREYALSLEKKILDLPDVSAVSRKGLRDQEIWVQLTPEKMQEEHLSLMEVIQALRTQNTTLPGGKFYENNVEYILKTNGSYDNSQDVKDTVVRASALGKWLTVGDIAEVKDAFEEETIINKTKGKRSINLTIIKKASGDSITLVDNVRELANKFLTTAPKELRINYINDLSFYIRRRLNVLVNNGIIGLIMVAASLFFFLSVGSAIGACIGIPTALLMTFSLMHGMDISINLLSLFGLIMVLGMLVDEDIVIAENVYRHIDEDPNANIKDAAIRGANEVSLPVIATALTTIAAFIPIYMMGGIMGKFTQHIPTIIIVTLLASLVEAIIILPSHVSDITEKLSQLKKWLNRKKQVVKKRSRKGHAFLNKTLKVYDVILRFTLKQRYLYLLVLFFMLFGALKTAERKFQTFELFPSGGVEIFFIRAEGPIGDSLETTTHKLQAIEKIVDALPENELETFTAQIGLIQQDPNDPNTKRGPQYGQVVVYLTPQVSRDRDTKDIITSLREDLKSVAGFKKITVDEVKNGPPSGKPIEVKILGDSFEVMKTIAAAYKAELKKQDGVYDVQDDYNLNKDEIQIQVDSIKAAQLGLDLQQIASNVRYAFEGAEATSIKTAEEEINVIVKFPPRFRESKTALENLLIPNNKGNLVALSQVATFEKIKSVQSIVHFDHSRNINVTASVDPRKTSPIKIQNLLKKQMAPLLKDYPNYQVEFGGEGEDTQESLDRLQKAFLVAVGLILFILIAMFRSLAQPLIIAFTIPFTIIGVIMAFDWHDQNLNFMAILGVVGLTGIVVDAGIIMIDFINKFRAAGMPFLEAVVKGAIVRFRAVLLVTLTTVLGLIPAAYGIGGSDPFIAPMALAMNYGMIFSTILTLIYIPIFLAILEDIYNVFRRLRDR